MGGAMILNEEQAKAVYNAMCQLNNIGGILHARIIFDKNIIHIREFLAGTLSVWIESEDAKMLKEENYYNQNAFAAEYNFFEDQ